jgi:hypothetical protein
MALIDEEFEAPSLDQKDEKEEDLEATVKE